MEKTLSQFKLLENRMSYYDMYTVKVRVRQLSLSNHDVLLQNVRE